MCDYSLCSLPTRLAIEGEELVVHRFPTGSMGLAASADFGPLEDPLKCDATRVFWTPFRILFRGMFGSPVVKAVCIPPGAQLILRCIPKALQRRWHIEEEEEAFFLQISAKVNSYRDAIRFSNGQEVLLQSLREGIRVQVLSLGNATSEREWNFAMPAL